MFKLVCILPNGPLKNVLKRLRLYYPPLHRLMALSKGNTESLVARSKEFSELLNDVLINGVWKRTGLGRLTILDEWVVSFLTTSSGSFKILDVGGSDGSTTFDTLRYFQENLNVEAKAAILELHLRLHCFRRGCLRYYLTHDQSPLLLQIGPLGVLFEETKGKEGVVFNPIVRIIKKYLQCFSLEKYLKNDGDLILQSPLVENSPNIIWIEQNLFHFDPAMAETFDFIRCCNVLNCGYFSDAQIYDAVRLLTFYLKHKGLLLVSRTIDTSTGPLHTASLWMKNGEVIQHISDLNGGSEVKKIVTANGPTPQ